MVFNRYFLLICIFVLTCSSWTYASPLLRLEEKLGVNNTLVNSLEFEKLKEEPSIQSFINFWQIVKNQNDSEIYGIYFNFLVEEFNSKSTIGIEDLFSKILILGISKTQENIFVQMIIDSKIDNKFLRFLFYFDSIEKSKKSKLEKSIASLNLDEDHMILYRSFLRSKRKDKNVEKIIQKNISRFEKNYEFNKYYFNTLIHYLLSSNSNYFSLILKAIQEDVSYSIPKNICRVREEYKSKNILYTRMSKDVIRVTYRDGSKKSHIINSDQLNVCGIIKDQYTRYISSAVLDAMIEITGNDELIQLGKYRLQWKYINKSGIPARRLKRYKKNELKLEELKGVLAREISIFKKVNPSIFSSGFEYRRK